MVELKVWKEEKEKSCALGKGDEISTSFGELVEILWNVMVDTCHAYAKPEASLNRVSRHGMASIARKRSDSSTEGLQRRFQKVALSEI